jgi:diadenosine tetraphosphate (Ap4A) HIT family hydrolase
MTLPSYKNLPKFNPQFDQIANKSGCPGCLECKYETAPLIETKFFKVFLRAENQFGPGRMQFSLKYHIDVDSAEVCDAIMIDRWNLQRLLEKALRHFYGSNEIIVHFCQLGNMSGHISDSHTHFQLIPRTPNEFIMPNGQTYVDVFWGKRFNNKNSVKVSLELLEQLRLKMVDSIKTMMQVPIFAKFKNDITFVEKCLLPEPFKMPKCMQCEYESGDRPVLEIMRVVLKSEDKDINDPHLDGIRWILRGDDGKLGGRSVLIWLKHMHPTEAKLNPRLMVLFNIMLTVVHATWQKIYNVKSDDCRALVAALGSLSLAGEHYHMHYVPSCAHSVKFVTADGTEHEYADPNWGEPFNIDPTKPTEERPRGGYVKTKVEPAVREEIRQRFKQNIVNPQSLKDQIIDTIMQSEASEFDKNVQIDMVNQILDCMHIFLE